MSNVALTDEPIRARVGNPAMVGALVLTAAAGMFLATLGGSYWAVHTANAGEFVTQGMKFNTYGGALLAITGILGSLAVEFAMSGVRQGQLRWGWMGWA